MRVITWVPEEILKSQRATKGPHQITWVISIELTFWEFLRMVRTSHEPRETFSKVSSRLNGIRHLPKWRRNLACFSLPMCSDKTPMAPNWSLGAIGAILAPLESYHCTWARRNTPNFYAIWAEKKWRWHSKNFENGVRITWAPEDILKSRLATQWTRSLIIICHGKKEHITDFVGGHGRRLDWVWGNTSPNGFGCECFSDYVTYHHLPWKKKTYHWLRHLPLSRDLNGRVATSKVRGREWRLKSQVFSRLGHLPLSRDLKSQVFSFWDVIYRHLPLRPDFWDVIYSQW